MEKIRKIFRRIYRATVGGARLPEGEVDQNESPYQTERAEALFCMLVIIGMPVMP